MNWDELIEAIRDLESAATECGYYSDGSTFQKDALSRISAAWNRITALIKKAEGDKHGTQD